MPNTPVDTDEDDFVLKHRIAGAAFLLFFGALVLPWLLGAPSDAKKNESTDVVKQQQPGEEYVPQDLENEVLTQLKAESEADEKVYISKVTPAGFTQVSETSPKDSEDSKSANAKQAEAQKLAKEKAEKEKQIAAQAAADKKAKEQAELAKANQQKAQESKAEKEKQAALAKQQAEAVAKAEQAAKKKSESSNNIKSGWIVQVGVFTDKSGADKISKSLGDKGFKASSTTVDTNKGPGTGTRVWLGPYSDRAAATKAKTNLADKTGTSGFIRTYP